MGPEGVVLKYQTEITDSRGDTDPLFMRKNAAIINIDFAFIGFFQTGQTAERSCFPA